MVHIHTFVQLACISFLYSFSEISAAARHQCSMLSKVLSPSTRLPDIDLLRLYSCCQSKISLICQILFALPEVCLFNLTAYFVQFQLILKHWIPAFSTCVSCLTHHPAVLRLCMIEPWPSLHQLQHKLEFPHCLHHLKVTEYHLSR